MMMLVTQRIAYKWKERNDLEKSCAIVLCHAIVYAEAAEVVDCLSCKTGVRKLFLVLPLGLLMGWERRYT